MINQQKRINQVSMALRQRSVWLLVWPTIVTKSFVKTAAVKPSSGNGLVINLTDFTR